MFRPTDCRPCAREEQTEPAPTLRDRLSDFFWPRWCRFAREHEALVFWTGLFLFILWSLIAIAAFAIASFPLLPFPVRMVFLFIALHWVWVCFLRDL